MLTFFGESEGHIHVVFLNIQLNLSISKQTFLILKPHETSTLKYLTKKYLDVEILEVDVPPEVVLNTPAEVTRRLRRLEDMILSSSTVDKE